MKGKLPSEDLQLWKNQLKDVKPLSKEEKGLKELALPKKHKIPQPRPRPLEKLSPVSGSSLPPQNFGRQA